MKVRHIPWFFLLAPLCAVLWLGLRPSRLPPDWYDVGLATVHVIGATVGYIFIRRLGSPLLEIGWMLIGLQSTIDLCDEFTSNSHWDTLFQTLFAVSGYIVLTVGVVRSHTLFLSEAAHSKQREEQLQHEATHDKLTGLANSAHFLRELSSHWENLAPSRRSSLAVLFVDLDGFKAVNDKHGHLFGDELLQIVARRLRSAVRKEDLVARMGGDEFAALICDVTDSETLEVVLERVHRRLSRTANINGIELAPNASVGAARGSLVFTRPKELLRAADVAMYAAKRHKLGADPSAAA
ncbi:MAG: GGDEF domain-containing protein [Bryobacterales bacterium]|nr:GGDEF domain-containing protein [Bryobacterales bacterium]